MKEKKKIVIRCIVEISSILLQLVFCILLFVAAKNRYDILAYASGLIVIISLITQVLCPFIFSKRIKWYDWIVALVDFVLAIIFISIYLLSINDDSIRQVIVAVATSVLGGLMSLFGVAYSIKATRQDKEDEEIRIYRPLFTIFKPDPIQTNFSQKYEVDDLDVDNSSVNAMKSNVGKHTYKIDRINIANSDFSLFSIKGLRFNGKQTIFFKTKTINRGVNIILRTNIIYKTNEPIDRLELLIADALWHEYLVALSFSVNANTMIINDAKTIDMISY